MVIAFDSEEATKERERPLFQKQVKFHNSLSKIL